MKKTLLALVILNFLPILLLHSQDLKSNPLKSKSAIEIDVNGAFSYALFNLNGSGNLKEFWKFKNYGVSTGFGTNAEIKLSVLTTKSAQLKIHIAAGYTHFSNDDNKAYNVSPVELGWPYISRTNPSGIFTPQDTAGTSYLRLNMPSFAFGLECAVFMDKENKSSFNFGIDFLSTLITGRAYETISNSEENYFTISPSLRFGTSINISYSYKIEDWVGFNIGTRFAMPNLLGKSSEMTDQNGYISLLDDSNIALNPNLSSKRTMGYLQLFGGVAFYLGRM